MWSCVVTGIAGIGDESSASVACLKWNDLAMYLHIYPKNVGWFLTGALLPTSFFCIFSFLHFRFFFFLQTEERNVKRKEKMACSRFLFCFVFVSLLRMSARVIHPAVVGRDKERFLSTVTMNSAPLQDTIWRLATSKFFVRSSPSNDVRLSDRFIFVFVLFLFFFLNRKSILLSHFRPQRPLVWRCSDSLILIHSLNYWLNNGPSQSEQFSLVKFIYFFIYLFIYLFFSAKNEQPNKMFGKPFFKLARLCVFRSLFSGFLRVNEFAHIG